MSTLDELKQLLQEPQTQDRLDDLVHHEAAEIASRINNGGQRVQLDWLRQQGYVDSDFLENLRDE